MGLGDRRPTLPAPTDSLIDSADEAIKDQDLATNLSRLTDASHHTVPDDGTPITIATSLKRTSSGSRSHPAQQSQASLLIEYFENHSDPDRRPSIRVRVAPSRSKATQANEADQPVSSRAASHNHRIPLRSLGSEGSEIVGMTTQRLSRPFAPDYQQNSEISVLSDSPPTRFMAPESDVSSMPADSILGVSNTLGETSRMQTSGKENLKPPVTSSDRNRSSDLLTQKVIEKLAAKPRSSTLKTIPSERRSSSSREVEATRSRRKSAKNIEEDSITGSSLVSGSAISELPKSHDGRSVRSGQSHISINNPKLLQTVEDAIRRLILPELKEIKNDQQKSAHRKHRKEYPSDLSESSISREELSHRRSSGKSRRTSSGKGHSHRVSSGSRRHERSHKTVDESPSEQSYDQSESNSSMSIDGDSKGRKHQKSHRARDVGAGALAGAALTAAALKHHDSGSSADHRERRKKRSKSRSTRSESFAEDEEVFHKNNVPPMPFRSDLDSTVTRSSIKSSKTNGSVTPTRHDLQHVVRGSPADLQSPTSLSPSGTPGQTSNLKSAQTIQSGLGTHHGNFSNRDLAGSREDIVSEDGEEDEEDEHGLTPGYGPFGHGLLTDPERARAYERNLHTQHPIRRGLSPIQSVASYATTEPTRNSMIQPRSRETLSSPIKERVRDDNISEVSYSSANSIDMIKAANRPQGLSLENRSEIMQPYKDNAEMTTRRLGDVDSPEGQYRDSFASSELKSPVQARSTFTEDSLDSPYIDKVTAGQQVGYRFAAIPEFINGSEGPESAVASLVEASTLDSGGGHSPPATYTGSPGLRQAGSPGRPRIGSPLKEEHPAGEHDTFINASRGIVPPVVFPHSRGQSSEKLLISANAPSANPNAAGEAQDATSPESEITTNPSVIQGPIAGYVTGDTSHWPYGPTPPPMDSPLAPGTGRSLGVTAPELVPEPLSMGHGPEPKRDLYTNRQIETTPPGPKDEGYETGANAPSPAIFPEQQSSVPRGLPFAQEFDYDGDDGARNDDPFTSQKRDQYISGLSHGMSPLYDNATGRAADRIYDKDIRALMDHLTVRDAQRNARDTEILITLVRTAAEMRNSFEDMKKMMVEQGDVIVEENSKQHLQTQKAIGGPRPPPASTRFTRTPTFDDENLPNKRRSVFRRALLGLGNKNAQELQNIESMLVQLLDGFEDLRAQQTGHSSAEPGLGSLHSADNTRAPTDTGYEPEGQAGTSSTGDRSGIFSNNSSRQADYRGYNMRQESGNRVSTVMERDEEYDYDNGSGEEQQRTPRATNPGSTRDASDPIHTPPRLHDTAAAAPSNEHTPHVSTETSSGRKHKSFASSFLPKMVSRWSKTTASSGDYRASTQQKPRPYSQVSHSGSNVVGYEYDPQGDDALHSHGSFHDEHYRNQENRPPSPLIPSQVSDTNPKYQGFRNSLNLQHPQPRPGPTGRFQNHLESEAQYYTNDPTSPTSVTSSQWEAQAAVSGMPGSDLQHGYQHGGQLSPIQDDDRASQHSASSTSRHGPPRPPKEPHDDPLVPPRPPKVVMSPPGSRQPTYVDHVAAARAGSPAFDKSPVTGLRSSPGQSRKPSGPRPLSTSGQYSKGYNGDLNSVKRTRFRGSPNQIDSDENLADHVQY